MLQWLREKLFGPALVNPDLSDQFDRPREWRGGPVHNGTTLNYVYDRREKLPVVATIPVNTKTYKNLSKKYDMEVRNVETGERVILSPQTSESFPASARIKTRLLKPKADRNVKRKTKSKSPAKRKAAKKARR